MTAGRGATAAIIILVAAFTAACGGPSAEERRTSIEAQGERLADEVAKRERIQNQLEAEAAAEECRNNIGDFLSELQDLDSQLDDGVNYSVYSIEIGDARKEYDDINVAGLEPGCVTAAASGEKAFNSYIRAGRLWGDCIEDFDCSTDSIDPQLQSHWSNATQKIEAARTQLEQMSDSVAEPKTWSTAVPASGPAVEESVYGAAVRLICEEDVPIAASEACADLRSVLSGGVEEKELGDMEGAVKALNEALGVGTT
jgi:hypothetical protein